MIGVLDLSKSALSPSTKDLIIRDLGLTVERLITQVETMKQRVDTLERDMNIVYNLVIGDNK